MDKESGKYLIDVSKLVFGGVVLAGIWKLYCAQHGFVHCRHIPESGTDLIMVARRETSGDVKSQHRSGEAPIYFIERIRFDLCGIHHISGLRRSGYLPSPTRRFTSGYREVIRSGFRYVPAMHKTCYFYYMAKYAFGP